MNVDTVTGEIVESISLEQAKRITEQIKLLAGAIADGTDRLVDRIREAQESRVHEVLGYRSWTEYVSTEFANLLPRLGREALRAYDDDLDLLRPLMDGTGITVSEASEAISTAATA